MHRLVEQAQARPEGFRPHRYERRFRVRAPSEQVANWLNDPRTFTKGQVWPYRVEFVDGAGRPGGFENGVVCTHQGPLMSLPAEIREVRDNGDRELRYLYGAYVLSSRWIRPTRLRFRLTEASGVTTVTMTLDSWCRAWIAGIWTLGQAMFWSSFCWTAPMFARRHTKQARRADLRAKGA